MTEDSKFSIVSPKSVKLYAEIFGVQTLTDDLASSLAEDVTYRLRETLQSASQFMKHAKRRRLSSEDFNKALERSSTEPIYGYGSMDDVLFRSAPTKDGDIFFVEDKEISLRELAMNVVIPTDPGQRSVKANWLSAEGTLPAGSHAQPNVGRVNNDGGSIQRPLSQACLSYYEQVTKAILGDDEQCNRVALSDLKTNPKIYSLLAYFVNFIASGVKTYSHDLTQLSKLLSMVRSLIDNSSLFLEPYVIQLVTAVMYCLLESLAASLNPKNDHWRLRDEAASILARISRKCSNPVNYLRQQLLMTLQEVLLDDGRPFCSHYGAVVGLTELGPEALEQYVIPHLRTYWTQLQQVLDDNSQSNALLQEEAYQVYGALLVC
ncbi:TAF6-like RNA polymerase II p300/CBP-associated factor-associated factor 65 kDa subunit 6L [Pocillopora damicornis]|uniref:TAF6-like RNA polymerase II p300/CBP-associated factor-associated factor 65 kDa subunit 6L n=1 Tax=Pocillopora damicornis TaxID=46731 RepID=UPI000F551560|nr:TAF6-like RNA polymerase II p300/CBP-associated factor-associated factor 65 kDa subunit 6L [Pocillopora damicornis]